jgi:hypothetical protein
MPSSESSAGSTTGAGAPAPTDIDADVGKRDEPMVREGTAAAPVPGMGES